ncbi:MAG: hypothetical protein U0805_20940 [Pirellulales bacterium]
MLNLCKPPAATSAATWKDPFSCERCGFDGYVDHPIHNGESTRRDCARCGRTVGFPVWYGEANPVNTRLAAVTSIAPLIGSMQCQVLDFIRERGERGAIDEEIAAALKMRDATARARRCELRDAGLVRDSTRRRRSTARRFCAIWVATNA